MAQASLSRTSRKITPPLGSSEGGFGAVWGLGAGFSCVVVSSYSPSWVNFIFVLT